MTSRYIPRVVNFEDGVYGEDTLYHRYPLGDNILSKSIYNNLLIIEPGSGKTLDDASPFVDFVYYNGSFYLKVWDTPINFHWLKLYLGPIAVKFDNIYTTEELDFLLRSLYFEGSLTDWNALTKEEKENFLVGRVMSHE